jgi:hypothetical protein
VILALVVAIAVGKHDDDDDDADDDDDDDRFFGGNEISATFYDEDKFSRGRLDDVDT